MTLRSAQSKLRWSGDRSSFGPRSFLVCNGRRLPGLAHTQGTIVQAALQLKAASMSPSAHTWSPNSSRTCAITSTITGMREYADPPGVLFDVAAELDTPVCRWQRTHLPRCFLCRAFHSSGFDFAWHSDDTGQNC